LRAARLALLALVIAAAPRCAPRDDTSAARVAARAAPDSAAVARVAGDARELRARFDADRGAARLILLLSPT
jgi:hypothetical protein